MSAETKPKRKAPNKKDLRILARRERILELRAGGASVRQISDHLIAEEEAAAVREDRKPKLTGLRRQSVHNDLAAALEDLHKNQRLKAGQLIQLEVKKLDNEELIIIPKLAKALTADEIEKYNRALDRIRKHRAALLGLLKPQEHKHSNPDGTPLAGGTTIRVILPAAAQHVEAAEE